MFNIIFETLENEFFCEKNLILKYKIEYPQVINNSCSCSKFNSYNFEIALNLQSYIENHLLQEAQNLYEYNKNNNYPIMVYEIIHTTKITYNKNNIISLYSDQYIFSGGAHGNTIRSSQNWNMQSGTLITLEQVFHNNSYFLLNILQNINNQILNNKDNYFDNFCSLILQTFKPNQFFVTSENSLCIFFQEYDIAPHSTGIPVFCSNY